MLEEQSEEVAHVGRDYLVLCKGERYAEVERSPEAWGMTYVKELPASIRKGLDPRGLLACPAVDKAFGAPTYAAEVSNQKPPLFLPTRQASGKSQRRLILISLSPAREKILLEDPELVHEIVSERKKTPIPGSLEFDARWIDLQRALFDFLWQYGADDERAEALTPRSGMSLYEDKSIDAARLVPSERARSIAQWVTQLPADVIERAAKVPAPSPAARNFPESLGSSEADDREPVRAGKVRVREARRPDPAVLAPELARLQAFYTELLRTRHAVLSIRFRE